MQTMTELAGAFVVVGLATAAWGCQGESGAATIELAVGETCSSIASGAWSSPATWSCGHAPFASDVVQLSGGHQITLSGPGTFTVGGLVIRANGALVFDPGTSVELAIEAAFSQSEASSEVPNNIVVEGALDLQPANAGTTHVITFKSIDETKFDTNGSPGATDPTPKSSDPGLWVRSGGRLIAKGASKTSWTRLTGSAAESDTAIVVEDATGWRPEDTIVIVPTRAPEASNDHGHASHDVRIVSNVVGNTVHFNPGLQFAHPEVNGKWRAEVLNLTRNVVLQGQANQRAHVLFAALTGKNPLSYVEIRHMGPRSSSNEGILGRYGLHFHHCDDATRDTEIVGLSLHTLGFRGYVLHKSHGITVRDSLAFDVWEEAFWWDPGITHASNDTTLDHNAVSLVRSNGARAAAFHLGLGDRNSITNSAASGVRGAIDGAGFVWPENTIHGVWTFHDNVSHNNDWHGIFTWQNGHEFHLVEDFAAYHNGKNGIDHGAYGNRYTYRNIELYANGQHGIGLTAVSTPDQVSPLTLENIVIDGGDELAPITTNGIAFTEHLSAPHAATLIRNVTVQDLKPAGHAFKFAYSGLPASSAPEWVRIQGGDLSDLPAEKHFSLTGSAEADGQHGVLPESNVFVEASDGAVFTLRSKFFQAARVEDFSATGNPPWPSGWVERHVAGSKGSVTLQSGKLSVAAPAVPPNGSATELVSYVPRPARNIDQTVTFRLSNATSLAGLVARRSDEDRETYYKVDAGERVNDTAPYGDLKIVKLVDGVPSEIWAASISVSANVDYKLRFKVEDAGSSTNLSAKLWPASATEPVPFTLVESDTDARLWGRWGLFGVVATADASGTALFDDHSSVLLDGVSDPGTWNALMESRLPSMTPIVDPGRHRSAILPGLMLPVDVKLDATVTRGLAVNPPSGLTYQWSQLAGPNTVVFTPSSSIDTSVTFPEAGLYHLRLSASDGSLSGHGDVRVIVHPAQASSVVSESWPQAPSWPARWVPAQFTGESLGTPAVTVVNGEGRIRYNNMSPINVGTSVQFVNHFAAEDVEIVAMVSANDGYAQAGFLARYFESDSDTYLGASVGTGPEDNGTLRIFMLLDGQKTNLAVTDAMIGDPPVAYDPGTDYRMRFRVETNADGTLDLRLKLWQLSAPSEPAQWTLEVRGWSNPAFQGRGGRVGVIGRAALEGRAAFFDDFLACAPFVESFSGTNGSSWPAAQWLGQAPGSPGVTIQTSEGRLSGAGSRLVYLAGRNDRDVGITSSVRLGGTGAQAGIFARRIDSEQNRYLAMRFGAGTNASSRLRIYQVDGTESDIVVAQSNVVFSASVDYRARFEVETNPDETIDLRVKIWEETQHEPQAWTLERKRWQSATFAQRAGRLGLLGAITQAGHDVFFDDVTTLGCGG